LNKVIILVNHCSSGGAESDAASSGAEQTGSAAEQATIGTLGWFQGPIGRRLGVVVDSDTLQLYDKLRHGFVPKLNYETLTEWTLDEDVSSYGFVEVGDTVFLQF
jgi:hypothetical protein